MIYTCQFCGAGFPKDQLKEAMSKNSKSITCVYCNLENDIGRMETSHIARGYERLEYGDFYGASMQFGEAIRTVEHLDVASMQKRACIEAYLGQALAQYSVQVIYNEEIAELDNPLETNCYICNDRYFVDSDEFQTALSIAATIPDGGLRAATVSRFNRFAKKIDGIKKTYDSKAEKNEKYQLFIACEDNSKDAAAGLETANKLRNNLPHQVNKVFVMDPDNYVNDDVYEGEILYAIHNSTCMLVVTDNDIDSRLMNIYARFYWAMATSQDVFNRKELCFVRFRNKIQIHLPDHRISNNIFEIYEPQKYHAFICDANGLLYNPGDTEINVVFDDTPSTEVEEQTSITPPPTIQYEGAPKVDGRICRFGSYPQHREKDVAIISQFSALPKPSASNPNGWEIMFTSRSGQPYTWYMDKEINGKKYRAVYFMKFREIFTLRESDLKPSVQRVENYLPMRIYVFAYDPIEWNILDLCMTSATLVSSVGLDCREFNNCEFCSLWECSSIRKWLNEDFFNSAFSEEEKKFIFYSEDESVSLLDSKLDFSKKLYHDKLDAYNISGTDYFKCIGGFCDRNVSNFWIKNEIDEEDRAAAVQPHAIENIVPQCVDNTAVSVVPKIKVKL